MALWLSAAGFDPLYRKKKKKGYNGKFHVILQSKEKTQGAGDVAQVERLSNMH